MPGLRVLNSSTNTKCNNTKMMDRLKTLNTRRQALEQIQKSRVQHIGKDLKNIFQREVEYTKDIIEKFMPVKIMWNESFFTDDAQEEKMVEPEVMESEEMDDKV